MQPVAGLMLRFRWDVDHEDDAPPGCSTLWSAYELDCKQVVLTPPPGPENSGMLNQQNGRASGLSSGSRWRLLVASPSRTRQD